jgi:hypothetical protein
MNMITIRYGIEGEPKTKTFADNRKGKSEAQKFLQLLHDERVNHPWFYKLKKVEILKDKMKGFGSRQTKKRYATESELLQTEKDRNELLQILDVSAPPAWLKIEIYRQWPS